MVSGFGLMNHASAMPASVHQMNQGGSHSEHSQSSSTSRCVTLCTVAVVSRGDELDIVKESEDDNDPVIPFYALTQNTVYDEVSNKVALVVAGVKPPSKIPIYILYSVFRV